ncbi:uncharacterized protein B0I36DRAFT_323400 [Microdochium trichocladiopsis]|uniref:Uncharacterized protein n=1 Tax=Microdochium trichocladiopsis TaxID=1682393 RepID=A0A9P8Y9E3_9PEZI|nr:uncharacterized protein B0I36DRAFT_323400 [Microdochium trichocladiopsis]KAH7031199.1 hypothetical protein B0I36DRAFT_323400 [Microdochium trichocladiopsis]
MNGRGCVSVGCSRLPLNFLPARPRGATRCHACSARLLGCAIPVGAGERHGTCPVRHGPLPRAPTAAANRQRNVVPILPVWPRTTTGWCTQELVSRKAPRAAQRAASSPRAASVTPSMAAWAVSKRQSKHDCLDVDPGVLESRRMSHHFANMLQRPQAFGAVGSGLSNP